MTVNQTATRAGRKYQRDITRYLRDQVLIADDLALSGSEDEGDVRLMLPDFDVVIEAKRAKRIDLAGWVQQAKVEACNFAKHRNERPDSVRWAVVSARRNHGVGKSYVILELDEWLKQLNRERSSSGAGQ